MTKRQYIDGLIQDFFPGRDGVISCVHVDGMKRFAEKVYRYAMRNKKRQSAERTVKEMFKEKP